MPETVQSMAAARMPPAPPTTTTQSRGLTMIMPLVFIFYSLLLFPPEVGGSILGVNLPSYRQAVLLMAAPSLWILMKGGRANGLALLDYVVMFMGFWIMLSFMSIYGVERGLVRGAGIVIDNAVFYMVARASVTNPTELRYFLLMCVPGLLFAGGSLVIESLSGQVLVRSYFARIFGSVTAFRDGDAVGAFTLQREFRLGMMRAYGPFSHPILAGTVMTGFLPLFYFSGIRSWPYLIGVGVALTGFFSLSSAAFLFLIIGFGAIAIHHMKPFFPKLSWWAIISVLGLLVLALHISSKNGIIAVISRMTLTPSTADYRILIWRYGSQNVAENPWFGLGYNSWERLRWMVTDSVDAHFLLLAMRHGLIVPVILMAGIVHAMIKLGVLMPTLDEKDRAFMIGLNITMFGYLIVGQTVTYFGSVTLVFMAMVAFLASMTQWTNSQAKAQAQQRLTQLRSRLYASPA